MLHSVNDCSIVKAEFQVDHRLIFLLEFASAVLLGKEYFIC